MTTDVVDITITAKLITEGDRPCNTTHHVLTIPSICSKQELVEFFERQCGLGKGSITAEEIFVIDINKKYLNKRVRGEDNLLTHRAKKAENNYYTISPSDEIVVFTKAVNISRPSKRCSSPSLTTRSLAKIGLSLTPHKFSRIDDPVIPDIPCVARPVKNSFEIDDKHAQPPKSSAVKESISKNSALVATGAQIAYAGRSAHEQNTLCAEGDENLLYGSDAVQRKAHPTPSTERLASSWILKDQHFENERFPSSMTFRQLAISPGQGCSDYHYNLEIESVLQQEQVSGEDNTSNGDRDYDEDEDDVEDFKSLVDYISRQLGENMIAQALPRDRNTTTGDSAIELDDADSEYSEGASLCSVDCRSVIPNTEQNELDDESDGDVMRNRAIVYAEDSDPYPDDDNCDASILLSALGMKVSVTLGADGSNVSAVDLGEMSVHHSKTWTGNYSLDDRAQVGSSGGASTPQLLSDFVRSVKDKCDELIDGYLSHNSNKGNVHTAATQAFHVLQETQNISPLHEKNIHSSICKPILVKDVFLDLDDLMNT